MGNKINADIRGGEDGLFMNLVNDNSQEAVDAILENEKVQKFFEDQGVESIPTEKSEVDDFLAELKDGDSKFDGLFKKFQEFLVEQNI